MDKTPNSQTKINDKCPAWASQMIARIRDIEVEQGNVNPGGDWQQRDLQSIQGRVFGTEDGPDDAEVLFAELAKRLVTEGFTPADVVAFVNARIVSQGANLPYCSVAEVTEALGES